MKQEANTPLILTIGAVGGLLVIVIVIGLQAWFVNEERHEMARHQDAPNMLLENARLDQQLNINGYRWIDREKQIVAIPIDEAMKAIVQNNGRVPATQPN